MFEQTAERVAAQVTNELAPSFRVPLWMVCPSREAEQAVLGAVTRAAQTRQIPVEVIDLEPDPAGRLNSLTSQLDDWDAIKSRVSVPSGSGLGSDVSAALRAAERSAFSRK